MQAQQRVEEEAISDKSMVLQLLDTRLTSDSSDKNSSDEEDFEILPGVKYVKPPLKLAPQLTSQPLPFGRLQQCGPGSQFGKGQFSTSQSQQIGKPMRFGVGLQTNMGPFNISQPPQFTSFREFCINQQASSLPQAPRSREGRLPSASSQGPLAPVIPQDSCLQHPPGSALTTPQSQLSTHLPVSSPLSQNQHELRCRASRTGRLESPSYVMMNDEGYEHALSPWKDQTVFHPTRVLPMVPLTKASFVADCDNMTEFGNSSMVNVSAFGPPLGDMEGLVSEASHQTTPEPPSNCTSRINWGSFGSRANDNIDNLEEISSISMGQNTKHLQV